MKNSFKYVVIEKNGLELVRIGTRFEQHEDLVKDYEKSKLISGGFFNIEVEYDQEQALTFRCFGESVGLKVKSRPEEDTELIKRLYEFEC